MSYLINHHHVVYVWLIIMTENLTRRIKRIINTEEAKVKREERKKKKLKEKKKVTINRLEVRKRGWGMKDVGSSSFIYYFLCLYCLLISECGFILQAIRRHSLILLQFARHFLPLVRFLPEYFLFIFYLPYFLSTLYPTHFLLIYLCTYSSYFLSTCLCSINLPSNY